MVLIRLILFFLLLLPVAVHAGGSPSGKTLNDLVGEVEYLVDEDPYFTSAQILEYLNAAINDVSWQTKCLEETYIISVTAGVTEYSLSGVTFMAITSASWLESGTTTYKPLLRRSVQADLIVGEEKPAWYYERAGNLGIMSVIDPEVSGSTVYMTYIPAQSTLGGTDSVPTPASLDQALVFYAAARCFFRDKQWMAYAQAMSLYGQYLQAYLGIAPPEEKPQH